ncbi:MAG TPA: ABC transporter ATP-binding protein [Candidatus Thalassarchaeaceae archaeon]|jgi:sodium transport system ATP-binding protein|nr:ABC transporter ATP-binding protein [Candidatus Thalassarchaeaceae archaeon]
MSTSLLVVDGVSKNFGDVAALSDVSIQLNRGEIVGLVGGNGAGKTTLLRLLCGVYRPSDGTVRFVDDGENRPVDEVRGRLGVVPESTGLYSRLTAWENIRYHTRIHGREDEKSWARTVRFARALDIENELNRPTRGFSRGMRQKIALIRAIAHGPDLLLLDEPTAGLDVTSARKVRDLVRQLGNDGGTVIYSTHMLSEAQRICDRIIILHNGTVRADGSPQELLENTSTNDLEDAYIALTGDVARSEPLDEGSPISGFLTRLFSRPNRVSKEVEEE